MSTDCVHQYWDSENLPAEVEASLSAISRKNAEFSARLWSQLSAAEFIRRNYGEAVAALFSRCRLPAMQADFFRYCVLLLEGGMYLDSDAMLHVPFALWIDDEADIVLPITNIKDPDEPGLGNGFIVSGPGNPLLAFALGQCLYNVSRETENNVARVTGPRTLHCALRFKRNLKVQLVDPREKYLDNFYLVVGDGSDHWSRRQQSESIFNAAPGELDWKQWSVCLSGVCLPGHSLEYVELGFHCADFENRMRQGLDTGAVLRVLLQHCGEFDFSPLEAFADFSGAKDYEQYDELIKQWRIDLVKPETLRFEQNLETLVSGIIAGGKLPAGDAVAGGVSPGLWYQASMRLVELGQEILALAAIRRSLSAIEYDRKIWQHATRLLYRGKCYREAEACALQIFQREPDNSPALHYLAQACEKLGDLERARGFAQRFALQSESPAAHKQLQRIERKLVQSRDDVL